MTLKPSSIPAWQAFGGENIICRMACRYTRFSVNSVEIFFIGVPARGNSTVVLQNRFPSGIAENADKERLHVIFDQKHYKLLHQIFKHYWE